MIGGETAEMPSFYGEGEYDLAGFAVGVVDRPKIIDGKQIVPVTWSSGWHRAESTATAFPSCGKSCWREPVDRRNGHAGIRRTARGTLLTPTRIYAKQVLSLMECCPIKGDCPYHRRGITDNLPRVFPARCGARIRRGSWPVLPIFEAIQARGSVPLDEMYRVFNMGIG